MTQHDVQGLLETNVAVVISQADDLVQRVLDGMHELPDLPGAKSVGRLIRADGARKSWLQLVITLHMMSRPGYPLEGWLFHGTSLPEARSIVSDGMQTTEALLDPPGGKWGEYNGDYLRKRGTFWASAWVAAFYAEDRIESLEDPDLPLALIAVRRDVLAASGPLHPDICSVEVPLDSRLGMSNKEVVDRWLKSKRDASACFDIVQSLVCLGVPPKQEIALLASLDDVRFHCKAACP